MGEETRRGAVLTIFAALFVLLALSDISKPLREALHRLSCNDYLTWKL